MITSTKFNVPVVTFIVTFTFIVTLVETKYFNVLIKNKEFFDHLLKDKQEGYEKLLEMSNIMIIQQEIYSYKEIPQQINFIGKLDRDDGAIMLFTAKKQQKY